MRSFCCQSVARLRHQLGLSPWRHRLHHIEGIIRAISLVDSKKDYPYSFVEYLVTGFRSRGDADETVYGGKSLIEDLVEMADDLTRAHPLPLEAAGRGACDAEALAARFKVSTKTISRWRSRGLVSIWFDLGQGRTKPIFTTRAVQVFISRNLDLVRRGSSFRLMDEGERQRIVRRARELTADGLASLHAVTVRLAEETGRAVETIRYTLRRFDFENPSVALFDRNESAARQPLEKVVHDSHSAGDSIRDLALRFGKTEREIRSLIHRSRISQYAASPIEYIYCDEFDSPDAESAMLLDGVAEIDDEPVEDPAITRIPSQLPSYLQELYRTPLLSAARERRLFRQMNYLLHRAEMARREIAADPANASAANADSVDRFIEAATVEKNRLIQANLRLVVSIAKRHAAGWTASDLFELISDGNMALIRAVEKFDYSRGFRFSTYATWAITRAFARSVPDERTRSTRFRTGFEEVLASADDPRSIPFPSESDAEQLRTRVAGCLARLEPRERAIVEQHFGISGQGGGRTLDEIGREFGLSKERVRQIEVRALRKLKASLSESSVEVLAG
ncbi:MAG: sigma-70 family RNA polymerase sigma factor [Phycisphaerae bacterium]|nr:sigma-70 family RNA polymerase sigma factor [Phycisphaerae bacterium]